MPNFESPIGSRNFSSRPLREIDVPDESGYSNSLSDSINEFQSNMENYEPLEVKQVKERRQPNKLNDGAKKRIEILLGMTRTKKEVIIENNSFVLQSLKSKELSEAYMEAAKFDGTVQSPFEIRRQLLARSLSSIANVDFEQFISSRNIEDKLSFIDEMDHGLLNRLYDEYLRVVNENSNKFSIKSEDDAREVIENLKK